MVQQDTNYYLMSYKVKILRASDKLNKTKSWITAVFSLQTQPHLARALFLFEDIFSGRASSQAVCDLQQAPQVQVSANRFISNLET